MTSRTQLAQLICTRLCHDLAGPVGAVAAGVELIGDDPSMVDGETLGLISASSAAASKKLKFLRAALGTGAQHSAAALADVEPTVIGFLAATAPSSGAPTLKWPAAEALARLQDATSPAAIQVLLNALLVVLEALPATRDLAVDLLDSSAGWEIGVRADSEKGVVRQDIIEAVADPERVLPSARNAQALYWVALAQDLSASVSLARAENTVTAVVKFERK